MTKRQSECLAFIKQFWEDHGYAPKFEHIRIALGLKSKSSVHRLIHALRERGLVEFTPHRRQTVRPV